MSHGVSHVAPRNETSLAILPHQGEYFRRPDTQISYRRVRDIMLAVDKANARQGRRGLHAANKMTHWIWETSGESVVQF